MSVEDEYCSIPIDLVIKYGENIPFDMFLKLSEGKVVKISHKEADFQDEFTRYKQKGIQSIYAKKEDYLKFLEKIKDGLTFKFFDSETTEEQVKTLDSSQEVMKKSIQLMGITPVALEMAQQINAKSIKMIQSQPNIAKFFKEFKDKCKREFMQNILTSYLASAMIDTFSWASPSMKEKASLAIMLRDILLDDDDFEELRLATSKEELSSKIIDHPAETAKLMESDRTKSIPPDVISMIHYHHEEPDGSGFPLGLSHQRINQLLAIIIVADKFIQLMIECKFELAKKNDIMTILYGKYQLGTFHKAAQSIQKIFG